MINGFENITADLSEYEKSVLMPLVIRGLKTKVGEHNAITSTKMIKALRDRGHKLDGARLRKIIHVIRVKGLVPCLVASSKGYWIETSFEKLKEYKKSLKKRADLNLRLIDAIDEQFKALHKQQPLFT